MKKLLFIVWVLITMMDSYSCMGVKQQEQDSSYLPKIHFASTSTDPMIPASLIHNSGSYLFCYQLDDSKNNNSKSAFLTQSKDLIHWGKPLKIKFATNHSDLLCVNMMNSRNETLSKHNTNNKSLSALLFVQNKNWQCRFILNHSYDNGMTWLADPDTIIFPGILVDSYKPSITWDDKHAQWIMTLATNEAAEIYSSKNLKSWHKECAFQKPAKLQLNTWTRSSLVPVNDKYWALIIDQQLENKEDGSVIQYYIGSFDGHEFKNQSTKPHWLDYGKDNIFSVICDGLQSNQKPIIIGLKSNTNYSKESSGQMLQKSMTFPRTLEIDSAYDEKMLSERPVSTINQLVNKDITVDNIKLEGNLDLDQKIGFHKTPIVLTVKFQTSEMTRLNFPPTFGVSLENDKNEKLTIGYNTFRRWYYIDRTAFIIAQSNPQLGGIQYMPCYHTDPTMEISIILDDNSIELFTENGKLAMTENFLPQQRFNHISLFAESGFVNVEKINVKYLDSIWKKE